ncbi:MAG: ABC transporter substrate-binding protein [Flavobacteriales bacterium]
MESAAELTALRIAGVPEHFNLPWQLGLERRAFVRAGIDLRWRTVPEGTGAMCELLRKGEVDMAVLVTEGAVRDILRGNPSRIVSHFVDSPLTWGVHVGAKTALHSAADLAQVPYAISRFNSGSHLMAMQYARLRGRTLTDKDLLVVNDLNGAVERLSGPEPVAFLWEKSSTSPQLHSGVLRRVDAVQNAWPAFVVVVRNEVLAEHAKAVQRVLKVVRDQAQGLMQKKKAPELVTQRYGLALADAEEWFKEVRWNVDGKLDAVSLMEVGRTLSELGLLDKVTTGESLKDILLYPS